MTTPTVLPIFDPSVTFGSAHCNDLLMAGMLHSGFPVPVGFQVTLDPYRQFVSVQKKDEDGTTWQCIACSRRKWDARDVI